MVRILTADYLLADVITQEKDYDTLCDNLKKRLPGYSMVPDEKRSLTKEQFEQFEAATRNLHTKVLPGGSSAGTLSMLSGLLNRDGKKNVDITFLGVTGDDKYGKVIRDSLHKTGITLEPATLPEHPKVETAVSFVVYFPDGRHSIYTYPGNARDILKPEMVTPELVKNCDMMYVPLQLRNKIGKEVPDRMLTLRAEANAARKSEIKLCITLPTVAKFDGEKRKTETDIEDENGYYRWLTQSAHLVLGNWRELTRIYTKLTQLTSEERNDLAAAKTEAEVDEIYGSDIQAISNLQGLLKERAIGFFTYGKEPAKIIGKTHVKCDIDVPENQSIVDTLGINDAAIAGFLAGHICGFTDRMSADIAMAMAGAKMRHRGPRLDDPVEGLKSESLPLAAELSRKVTALQQASAMAK